MASAVLGSEKSGKPPAIAVRFIRVWVVAAERAEPLPLPPAPPLTLAVEGLSASCERVEVGHSSVLPLRVERREVEADEESCGVCNAREQKRVCQKLDLCK